MFRLERVLADLLAALDQWHPDAEDGPLGVGRRPACRPALETTGPFEAKAQVRELPEV